MSEIICYTFNEYQSKYPEILKTYLDEYEDNTALLFWNNQQELYKESLDNVTLKLASKGFDKISRLEPLSVSIEEIHYKLIGWMEGKEYVAGNGYPKYSLQTNERDGHDNFYKSFSRILEFIEARILETTLKNNASPKIISEIDLSNGNAVQKIIYLKELGIIDLLRKEHCFSTSVNNLANVITAITGEKAGATTGSAIKSPLP